MFSDRLDRDASAFPSMLLLQQQQIVSVGSRPPLDLIKRLLSTVDLFNFSSFNTWDVLREIEDVKTLMDAIWYKGNTYKHAFTIWAVNLDRLPKRSCLVSWSIQIPSMEAGKCLESG
ncbi:hypothetical protein YC2023_114668 [Brassica napus]